MATKLTITRRHSESGDIQGVFGKKSKPIDYSWNSHELWINGRCNPEDHPFESVAESLFEACNEQIRREHPEAIEKHGDVNEVPFEAKVGPGRIIESLKIVEEEEDENEVRLPSWKPE